MANEVLVALKVLRKLKKLGDTSKIKVTLDGKALDKTDIDFHVLTYVLEAWRTTPQEYYRCEFPYFHPDNPELKMNGQEKYREKADVDLKAKEVSLEISFANEAVQPDDKKPHILKFNFPFV